jgi:hypothetical protein
MGSASTAPPPRPLPSASLLRSEEITCAGAGLGWTLDGSWNREAKAAFVVR